MQQLSIELPGKGPVILGCGSDSGTTCCVTRGDQAYVSDTFADLTKYDQYRRFADSIDRMCAELGISPAVAAHDLHPDYFSTRYAKRLVGVELEPVQHHHAHIAACMVENGLDGKVIGLAFDGMGLGSDDTLWGGEFLVCALDSFSRAAHFKQYPLPGGDQATLNPERMAFSCLLTELGPDTDVLRFLPGIDRAQADVLHRMLKKGLRSPITSSAGRLFDAVAALLGFQGAIASPGEAAIQLQTLAAAGIEDTYNFAFDEGGVLDFGPMIREIVQDIESAVERSRISAMFHNTLAAAAAHVCAHLAEREGTRRVALSGGVFFNELLKTAISEKLHNEGLDVYTHSLLPPGDACISLGQAVVAMARKGGGEKRGMNRRSQRARRAEGRREG